MTTQTDIITRCPQCGTAFRVSDQLLSVANGTVRCGSCLGVFKATEHIASTSMAATPKAKPTTASNHTDTSAPSKKAVSSPINDNDNVEKSVSASTSSISADKPNDDHQPIEPANDSQEISIKQKLKQKLGRFIHTDDDEILIHDDLDDDDNLLIHDNLALKDDAENDLADNTQTFSREKDIERAKNLRLNEDDHNNEIVTSPDFDINTFDLNEDSNTTHLFNQIDDSEHDDEAADESWAVDLLAEIDDDNEIQPIIKKHSRNKDSFKDSLAKSNELLANDTAATEHPNNVYQEIVQTDSLEEPSEDTRYDIYDDNPLSHDIQDHDIKDSETSNWGNTPEPQDHHDIDDYDDPLSAIEAHNHGAISDEAIENAMHLKTAYAGEERSLFESIPDPASFEQTHHRGHQALWITGIIIMGLLLALQFAWLRFDSLGKSATYRPYYATACNLLGCELPKLSDLTKIRATNLIVRSHPDTDNALIVDVILINRASFEQAYPAIRLEFSDVNDSPLAVRNFKPSEYLNGELSGTHIMPSNQPIQLSLALVDPGEKAINYRITVISSNTAN